MVTLTGLVLRLSLAVWAGWMVNTIVHNAFDKIIPHPITSSANLKQSDVKYL